MADVTIYKPANITVDVIDGTPPADQSAEVAALQAQVAQLQADLADMTAERDAAVAKIASGLAAAQNTVNALS